jgi:FKBP-type peptidyl-prolyl cis-trans isomerase FkpA
MSAVTAVPIPPLPKGAILKLWIAILLLAAGGAALAWLGTSPLQRHTTETGVQYQILEEGEGATITSADLVLFHFVARRGDGSVFATSMGREPVTTAPDNSFFPGVGQGLKLMRKGARYRFWLPPSQAFQGELPEGAGLSPDEVLSFDVQVVDVAPGLAAMQSLMGGPGGMGPDPHGGLPPGAERPPAQ